jgi:Tfp pilus assembly protein PilO
MIIRILLGVLGFLMCTNGAWYALSIRHQAQLTDTITQLEAQNTTLSLTVDRLRKQLQVSRARPVFLQTVPNRPDEPGILESLQQLATKTGVKILTISFDVPGTQQAASQIGSVLTNQNPVPPAPAGRPMPLKQEGSAVMVSVTVKGRDDELTRFVEQVEHGSRKATLDNVSYTFGENMLVSGLVLQLRYPYQQG